jgi:predicted GNAT family acetyltransferase
VPSLRDPLTSFDRKVRIEATNDRELLCPGGWSTDPITKWKNITMHPLDNVIWNALTTRQEKFAEVGECARKFLPEVTSLAGINEPSSEAYAALRKLVHGRETIALFLKERYQPQEGWELAGSAPLFQMVCENGDATAVAGSGAEPELIELSTADSAEMIELTALTKPGPFNKRTHELGTYLGIRRGGKLVAMAGERLKVPGFSEVSAVCTHPEHTGHGYARILMTEVMRRIRGRGETPFLHVREDNVRAIELYERIGFQRRIVSQLAVLRSLRRD